MEPSEKTLADVEAEEEEIKFIEKEAADRPHIIFIMLFLALLVVSVFTLAPVLLK